MKVVGTGFEFELELGYFEAGSKLIDAIEAMDGFEEFDWLVNNEHELPKNISSEKCAFEQFEETCLKANEFVVEIDEEVFVRKVFLRDFLGRVISSAGIGDEHLLLGSFFGLSFTDHETSSNKVQFHPHEIASLSLDLERPSIEFRFTTKLFIRSTIDDTIRQDQPFYTCFEILLELVSVDDLAKVYRFIHNNLLEYLEPEPTPMTRSVQCQRGCFRKREMTLEMTPAVPLQAAAQRHHERILSEAIVVNKMLAVPEEEEECIEIAPTTPPAVQLAERSVLSNEECVRKVEGTLTAFGGGIRGFVAEEVGVMEEEDVLAPNVRLLVEACLIYIQKLTSFLRDHNLKVSLHDLSMDLIACIMNNRVSPTIRGHINQPLGVVFDHPEFHPDDVHREEWIFILDQLRRYSVSDDPVPTVSPSLYFATATLPPPPAHVSPPPAHVSPPSSLSVPDVSLSDPPPPPPPPSVVSEVEQPVCEVVEMETESLAASTATGASDSLSRKKRTTLRPNRGDPIRNEFVLFELKRRKPKTMKRAKSTGKIRRKGHSSSSSSKSRRRRRRQDSLNIEDSALGLRRRQEQDESLSNVSFLRENERHHVTITPPSITPLAQTGIDDSTSSEKEKSSSSSSSLTTSDIDSMIELALVEVLQDTSPSTSLKTRKNRLSNFSAFRTTPSDPSSLSSTDNTELGGRTAEERPTVDVEMIQTTPKQQMQATDGRGGRTFWGWLAGCLVGGGSANQVEEYEERARELASQEIVG